MHCRECLTEKPLERFRKYHPTLCKDCHNARNRTYRARRAGSRVARQRARSGPRIDPEERRQRYLQYQRDYKKRPEVKARNKARRDRPENKSKIVAKRKAYYQATKEHKREYQQNKWRTDPEYKLRRLLRGRLWLALKGKSLRGSGVRNLGCDIPSFRAYIERLFKPGMTWANWGEWHLDHIKPLASFNLYDGEQMLRACHYTNFQPLWATDNLRKGAVYAQ